MATWLTIGVWLFGVVMSLVLGNRKLPIVVFIIGTVCTVIHFSSGMGYLYTSIMAILAVIMAISVKIDMA